MRTSKFLILFLVWIPASYGAKIKEPCSGHQDCPADSQCIVSKCNSEKICVCDRTTFPTKNNNGCYKVADRDGYCDERNRCRWGSYCANSRCTCMDGYISSVDSKFLKCKPILKGHSETGVTDFALHGEGCGDKVACVAGRGDVHCQDNECSCRPGFRLPKAGEINPTQFPDGCVPDEFDEADSC